MFFVNFIVDMSFVSFIVDMFFRKFYCWHVSGGERVLVGYYRQDKDNPYYEWTDEALQWQGQYTKLKVSLHAG